MIMITREIQFISVDYRNSTDNKNNIKIFVRIKYTVIDDDTTFTYFKNKSIAIDDIISGDDSQQLFNNTVVKLFGEEA